MTNSPPNKLFEGQTGFPTPNAAPEETGCRVFIIPSDEEWFALFMAAALRLTYEWAWYKNGDLSQAEAAAAWSDIIDAAYARSLLGTCLIEVPAPYWDETSADDAAAEMPPETQIWYGEIVEAAAFVAEDVSLTFLDNIGIWAIAGFIAYAGQPGAAIAFVPLAKTFVLAFKQNSLGGVVRVLIDFLHLADIDTYGVEDGVLNLSVVMPDDEDTHTIYVEMTDDNPHGLDGRGISVIRKRLTEAEVKNPSMRYNVDCDCIQRTNDGGATWVDDPGSDPRHSPTFLKPALATSDPRCDAAANMVKWIHDFIDQVIVILTDGGIIASIASKALEFFDLLAPEFADLLTLILALAGALFGIGDAALTTGFTEEQYGILLCIFYCNIGSDGRVTLDQLDRIITQINDQSNGTVKTVVGAILSLQGEIGLSNAGAIGDQTGDCSDCICEWEGCVDFTVEDGGFTALVSGGNTYGTWVDGVGWRSAYFPSPSYDNVQAEEIGRDFIEVNVTEIEFSVTYLNNTAPQAYLFSDFPPTEYTGVGLHWTGNEGWNGIGLVAQEVECTSIQYVITTKLRMRGTGTRPDFLSDC